MADQSNEMVERVARAISGAAFTSATTRRKARAAIEAMLGPTEEMMLAGEDDRWDGHVDFVWNAMIREALKPAALSHDEVKG